MSRRAVVLAAVALVACASPQPASPGPPGANAAPSALRPPSATPGPEAAVTATAGTSGASSAPSAAAGAGTEPMRLAGGGPRSVSGSKGLVVSANALATRAGVEVLEAGGNAMDAAVATALALAVTHPSAGNLGGGGFLLVRAPGGPTVALDFRETAPLSLTRAAFDRMIVDRGRGPVAVGVPGTVRGLATARDRFGSLPLKRLLEPAIRLARDGHALSTDQAAALKRNWASLRLDAQARRVFGGAGGRPLGAGMKLVQADLARTLELIASAGEAGFYTGPTAQAIGTATGKRVTEADLAGYRAVVREPLRARYRGFELETMPLPSTGGVLLAGELRALEALGASELPADSAAEVHLLIEVSRRAQALRRLTLVDPDSLIDAERRRREAHILEPASLLEVPIDRTRATPSAAIHPLYREALRETEHTTHLSVIDRAGMVVSLTTTLSASFGAKIMAPGTGVLLGNAVASFGSVGENQPVPGRRTTSSMAPTLLIAGGTPRLVLGTPGGDTIPTTLTLLVRRLVDRGMTLDEAVDAPRYHHGFVPDTVRSEAARPLAKAVRDELKRVGQHLVPSWTTQGDASSILIIDGLAHGYADPREGPGLALAATR